MGVVASKPGAGPDRPLWLPGSKVPEHLKGELPGDYGFDPLKLGASPQALRWYDIPSMPGLHIDYRVYFARHYALHCT